MDGKPCPNYDSTDTDIEEGCSNLTPKDDKS
jgi:hypothetical protein